MPMLISLMSHTLLDAVSQAIAQMKLPRLRGEFDGFVDYGSVVTTSLIASNTIGER
jgi:hypothetical protein